MVHSLIAVEQTDVISLCLSITVRAMPTVFLLTTLEACSHIKVSDTSCLHAGWTRTPAPDTDLTYTDPDTALTDTDVTNLTHTLTYTDTDPASGLNLALTHAGTNTSSINVHLDYEPLGTRPLLGEPPNPYLTSIQQAVRPHPPTSQSTPPRSTSCSSFAIK